MSQNLPGHKDEDGGSSFPGTRPGGLVMAPFRAVELLPWSAT